MQYPDHLLMVYAYHFLPLFKRITEVFRDDFSVYGGTFDLGLENLAKVLHRCEEVHLVLNWERYHFIVQEDAVLGRVVSHRGIEVDKAMIEVIECLPTYTCVEGGETVSYTHLTLPTKRIV